MPTDLKCYRVFIASPGGLQDERRAFRDEINDYNDSEAIPRDVLFRPVGWEETLGGVGRPQSLINEDVRKCDFFVLMLWDRWGTAPAKEGSKFSCGTEEEFRVAMECFDDPDHPMKQLVLFFKGVEPKQLSDAGPELSKVLEFKETIEQERSTFFRPSMRLRDFES